MRKYICFYCHKKFLTKAMRTPHEAQCPKRPRTVPKIGE